MDYTLLRQILISVGLWNLLSSLCVKSLAFCLWNLNITSVSVACHSFLGTFLCHLQCLFCFIILALNLTTISDIQFWELLSYPTKYSVNSLIHQYAVKDLPEDIFIFVMSIFLFHSVTSLRDLICAEFCRRMFFTFFFWTSYNYKLLGIFFFVSVVSFSFDIVRQSMELVLSMEMKSYSAVFLRRTFSWLLNCIWIYLFVFLVPVYCLFPILFTSFADDITQVYFKSFKISFAFYYIAEISHSHLGQYIVTHCEKFKLLYEMFIKTICHQNSMHADTEKFHVDEREETLKMYTAQGKSVQEIKKQMELMQMVKCVIGIRKKLKRSKENRERLLAGGNRDRDEIDEARAE